MTRDVIPANNLYTYSANNPVIFIDPSGYKEIVEDGVLYDTHSGKLIINYPSKAKKYKEKYKPSFEGTSKPAVVASTTSKSLTPKDIIPDAVGFKILDQSAALVGGYSAGSDIIISRSGVNYYGYIEGNVGPQALVDLSNQVVVAWNINNPDDYLGPYYSGNISLEWFGGINVSAAVSKNPTSSGHRSFVISIGPSLEFGGGGSLGRGNTYRAW